MKYILIVLALLTGACTRPPQDSDDSGFKNQFQYMDVLRAKDGFYKDFNCVLIREYSNSVFCQITSHKDYFIGDDWKTRQNFKKSEVIKVVEE